MSELNKNNNHWGLPNHKPDPKLWDKISDQMDKGFLYENLSDLTRDLPEHSPDPKLWGRINKELSKFSYVYFISRYKYYISSFIIILIAIILVFTGIFKPDKPPAILLSDEREIKTVTPDQSLMDKSDINKFDKSSVIEENNGNTFNTAKKGTKEFTNIKIELDEEQQNLSKLVDPTEIQQNRNSEISDLKITSSYYDQVKFSLQPLKKISVSGFTATNSQNSGSILERNNFGKTSERKTKNDFPFERFYFGIHFSPEIIFRKTLNINPIAWHLDFNAGYNISKWFVETGIGFSSLTCSEKYIYNYLQNDLIYKYTKVDSIIYTFDTIGMQLGKEFITSEVELYDSVEYQDAAQSSKKISYIQIPLMFGFKMDLRKTTLFFKSGILLSILQKAENKGFDINESGIRVLNMHNQTPCSISTNWQLIFGIGIAYKVHRKINIVFEPQFRYYLNSYYIDSGGKTKKPYSINLRAGIIYNF